jgi:tRNA(Ile)-lysidine synthase
MKDSRPTKMKSPEGDSAATLDAHVNAFCRRHELFRRGSVAVVAVSGGADSMCLLHCLSEVAPRLGIHLHVAHVHHGLRGADADADAEFVAESARNLGIPCTVERVDVRKFSHVSRESVEASARTLRYAALRAIASHAGAERIATGHTRDDQAETVLLNLMRGAGIDGLSGMRPLERQVARPLLDVSRQMVESYVAERRITARVDATNADPAYRRNAVRHEILPLMARYNPRVREALARTGSTMAQDADYLAEEAVRTLSRLRKPGDDGTVELDRGAFRLLPSALRFHVVSLAIKELIGSSDGFSLYHFESIDFLALARRAGRRGQLPHSLYAEAAGDRLVLSATARPAARPEPVELPVPGAATFGQWVVRAEAMDDAGTVETIHARPPRNAMSVIVDRAWADGPLYIRSRRPGDRVHLAGVAGRRKLQDLFVDAKLLRSERDRVPIVVGPRGIAWVIGYGQDACSLPEEHGSGLIRISAEYQALLLRQ